jgi:hypothetical protein
MAAVLTVVVVRGCAVLAAEVQQSTCENDLDLPLESHRCSHCGIQIKQITWFCLLFSVLLSFSKAIRG